MKSESIGYRIFTTALLLITALLLPVLAAGGPGYGLGDDLKKISLSNLSADEDSPGALPDHAYRPEALFVLSELNNLSLSEATRTTGCGILSAASPDRPPANRT